MVEGSFNFIMLWSAALVGAIIYIIKVPSITLGLGMYLPFGLSIPVFAGGVIRLIVDKVRPKQTENGTIVSSRNIPEAKASQG